MTFAFSPLAGAQTDIGETIDWVPTYEEALEQARETGKPILLEFRCTPCINGRRFDAKVVLTPKDSPRGKLMEQYICVRLASNTGIDIALFDRDWHNSLYFFIMNADEYIYMRYGGRDEEDAHTYLDLDSFELALRQGLEQHEKYERGELPPQNRPAPRYPDELPLLKEKVIDRARCVECHLIEDYDAQYKELRNEYDPLTTLFRSPDIKTIGIHLDIPKGLVVAEAKGAVAEAGMQSGDVITKVNDTPVLTFGDLQHHYDKTPRHAQRATFTVERDGEEKQLEVDLPVDWWVTDPTFRYMTTDPLFDFETRKLTKEEKEKHGFEPDGFACEVASVGQEAGILELHTLQPGDIIYAIDGVTSHPLTQDCGVYIKITRTAGESVTASIIRDGERIETEINTHRQYFRKEFPAEES